MNEEALKQNQFSFKSFANQFDDHISKSIRGYHELCEDIKELSRFCIDEESNVLDIGSSTGKMLESIYLFNRDVKNNVKYFAVEIENQFNIFYKNWKDPLIYKNNDIFEEQFCNCSFIYSIFTLQFLPFSKRKIILEKIYNWLNRKGVFIFCEKVDMESPFSYFFSSLILQCKRNYFSDNEILDKEYVLRYLMRKFSIKDNIDLCKSIGFSKVETFWQNHQFVGFICEK